MDSKLTLKLNAEVIEQAKLYAKRTNTSVSKLIENYLSALTSKDKEEVEISPIVESLTGIINLDDTEEYQKDYTDFLNEKYQ